MDYKNSLLGIIQSLFRWKKPILIITLAAAIGSSIISLLLPVYYEGTTIFYAASPDLAMPEAIFGSTTEGMEYYGEDEDIDRIMTIAESSELAEYLITAYSLMTHYDIDPNGSKAAVKVRDKFDNLYEVKKNKYDAIELSIEDRDSEKCAAMANSARIKINEIAQRLIKTSQGEILKTYESNILDKEEQLRALSDSLNYVRGHFGVYNTETQSELLATLLARAEARLSNAKARLRSYQKAGNVPRDTITILNATVDAATEEVATLKAKLDLFNQGMALVDVLAMVHEETSEQLGEDQQRYKQIKTAAGSAFPAIHVVEEAAVPIVKSRPHRTMLVLASTLIAFILCAIGVLMIDTYRDVDWKKIVDGK